MTKEDVIEREDGSKINVLINEVEKPIAQLIFAHGAGANMEHEFMSQMTEMFNELNLNVIRFNFPYMDKRLVDGKKYPPDRMPKLLLCYEEVVSWFIAKSRELPLFIGGKSMGSRVAATLMMEESPKPINFDEIVKGVFCIGYPFHPAKKPEKLRLEPVMENQKPLLILQGERDTLGNKEEIASYQLPKQCQCIFLVDGDHSLKPRVKSGRTLSQNMRSAAKHIADYILTQQK